MKDYVQVPRLWLFLKRVFYLTCFPVSAETWQEDEKKSTVREADGFSGATEYTEMGFCPMAVGKPGLSLSREMTCSCLDSEDHSVFSLIQAHTVGEPNWEQESIQEALTVVQGKTVEVGLDYCCGWNCCEGSIHATGMPEASPALAV